MQNRQSLLIGSTQASVGPEAGSHKVHCYLCEPMGSKQYARKGDLTRHIKTVHGLPSRFLCPIDRCPRGIPGAGFARRDKLVDHLKSSKPDHALGHQDAIYQASLHDASSLQFASLAASPSAFSIASAETSGPLTISQESFVQVVQQVGVNDRHYGSISFPFVPHGTAHGEATVPASWYGLPDPSNLAIRRRRASAMTDAQNWSIPTPAQETVDPGAFGCMFTGNRFEQDAFDDIFDVDGLDQGTLDAVFNASADDHAPSNDVFYAEDDCAW